MDLRNFVEPTMDDLVCDLLEFHTKPTGMTLEASQFYNFLNDFKIDKENENGELKYNIVTRKPNGIYYVPESNFNQFTDLLTVCADEVVVGEIQNKIKSGLKLDFDLN